MKNLSCLFLVTASALALPVTGAETPADLKGAIKKLSGQPNYSWTLTTKTEGSEAGSRQGPIEGKTVKDGFTFIKGTVGENTFQAAAKGTKFAVNYADEWVVVSEDDEQTARIAKRLKGLKDPINTAGDLAGKAKELKKDDAGAYAGELAPEAARDIFRTLGRRAAVAEEAKGTVKFWVKDGELTKYEFNVKGTITVGGDKKEVNLSRTVTAEFKDIGSTKVTLPDEVLKKFE